MSEERDEAIDRFVAEADAVLAEAVDAISGGPWGRAHRLSASDLPTGTVLWHIVREDPEQFREERLVRRDDGFWFEATLVDPTDAAGIDDGDDATDERDVEVLAVGPWPTARDAVAWNPDVLFVAVHDEITEDHLPESLLAEFLRSDDGEVALTATGWWTSGDAALDQDSEPVARWDTGDHYGAPGGDRTYELHRFGDVYVTYSSEDGVGWFGRYDDEDEAVRTWADWYLSGQLVSFTEAFAPLVERLAGIHPEEVVWEAVQEAIGSVEVNPVCVLGDRVLYHHTAGECWAAEGGEDELHEVLDRVEEDEWDLDGDASA